MLAKLVAIIRHLLKASEFSAWRSGGFSILGAFFGTIAGKLGGEAVLSHVGWSFIVILMLVHLSRILGWALKFARNGVIQSLLQLPVASGVVAFSLGFTSACHHLGFAFFVLCFALTGGCSVLIVLFAFFALLCISIVILMRFIARRRSVTDFIEQLPLLIQACAWLVGVLPTAWLIHTTQLQGHATDFMVISSYAASALIVFVIFNGIHGSAGWAWFRREFTVVIRTPGLLLILLAPALTIFAQVIFSPEAKSMIGTLASVSAMAATHVRIVRLQSEISSVSSISYLGISAHNESLFSTGAILSIFLVLFSILMVPFSRIVPLPSVPLGILILSIILLGEVVFLNIYALTIRYQRIVGGGKWNNKDAQKLARTFGQSLTPFAGAIICGIVVSMMVGILTNVSSFFVITIIIALIQLPLFWIYSSLKRTESRN